MSLVELAAHGHEAVVRDLRRRQGGTKSPRALVIDVDMSYAWPFPVGRPSSVDQPDRGRLCAATSTNRGLPFKKCRRRCGCIRCQSVDMYVHLPAIPQAAPMLTGTETYGQISLRVGLRNAVTHLRVTPRK
jgi:hypothetical protein